MADLVKEMGAAPAADTLEQARVQERTAVREANGEADWLCAWCLQAVARESDRFALQNQTEFSFKNPDGIQFHIITFSRTVGCRQMGAPTLDHTWFAGHAWSYCICDRCRIHLGWHYSGPTQFAGLMRDRIVRKQLVMN